MIRTTFRKIGMIGLMSLMSVMGLTSQNILAQPKREMRSAWVASVSNMDWPSKAAVGKPDLQKKEMIAILDSCAALHINMIIFQVRPTADALYPSDKEPWSSWLTGIQGSWPNGVKPYDPLAFICEEAHKRCIDVQVWLNPYRVSIGFGIDELAPTHIYRQHKEWFVKYGKQWYFNPGLDETRNWLVSVAADIVSRYDVDGLHFDDYFYPYRVKGEEFPDETTFKKYPRGFTDKEAWRRNNVDLVIRELHDTIKALKPWVEFGISPFGVWRNIATDPMRGSNTKAGVQNYDDLYADILLWMENKWIDYVVPQLYWEIGKKVADYEILAHWWSQYTYGQNLYIGHGVHKLGDAKIDAWVHPNEICRQLALNRSIEGVHGSVFFPVHTLLENKQGLCDSLLTNYYRYPALPPSVPTQNVPLAQVPTGLSVDAHDVLTWDSVEGAGRYVVYAFPTAEKADFDDPQYIVGITADTRMQLHFDPERYIICVTSVNRFHHESLPAVL